MNESELSIMLAWAVGNYTDPKTDQMYNLAIQAVHEIRSLRERLEAWRGWKDDRLNHNEKRLRDLGEWEKETRI